MIKINITNEQEEALIAQDWFGEKTLEKAVQFFFDDRMGVVVQNFNGKKMENLAKFLAENHDVADQIKVANGLDDSFKVVAIVEI